ncbi:glycosyltransferase family 1 protein [Methanobacterium sp. SMA-27]|uniref:glycosyltransferase family 4 protein n=1 Tax=Methanobacterium sp. SMA-27 TaxID=1495336 RepID=UPI00064EE3EE|nr:glycosyltransferase family 1 protein [Methanobacterium sp. SMA-27]
MRLGILSWILDRQRTGIDNYLYNIVEGMIKEGNADKISLIHYKKSNDKIYSKVNDVTIGSLPFNLINPLNLSKAVRETDIDVLHLPSHMVFQISPFFLNLNVKKVLTIHDLIPILFHRDLPLFYKLWGPTLKIIKNRPDHIITDSENTKNDCINYLGIPEDKIEVIYLASDKRFKLIKNKDSIKEELKIKYNIKNPFILCVGTIELRKNIPLLIKSFYKLLNKGLKLKLILIGIPGHGFNEISHLIKDLGISKEVIILGYVPINDLIKFYNATDLFVFPSFYEGFGLPPLEAMACGCPVVSSNTSSLPEVVGDAGIMVDPYDFQALTDKMYKILTNESLSVSLSNKSLNQAKKFNWQKTASQTWKIYEKVTDK